jgi:hypothetical protein
MVLPPVAAGGTFDWPDVGAPPCGAAPATDCHAARQGTLVWNGKSLAWTWSGKGDTAEIGDPLISTAYRLCLWDAGSQLAASAAIPA